MRAVCLFGFLLAMAVAWAQRGPEKPFVPNNRWALVVGASNYPASYGELKYSARDARDFAALLEGDLGFNPANVRLVADAGPPAQAPTSAHILAALDSLLRDKRLDKGNLFVFYFSGHGIGTEQGDFLLPSDVVPGQEAKMGVPIKAVIARIVAAGLKNVIFLTDACRAGEKNPFGQELNDLGRKANIAVLLGCSPGRRSYEYPELHHGAFTYFLMEALRDPKLRDASGAVWASKVGADLQAKVRDYTERDHGKYAQVPSLWAESSTLDVLLAAYPQPPISEVAFKAFKDGAQRLDRSSFANACVQYASALFDQDRFDLAVETLKLVDQLGESTPGSQYTLGVCLNSLGRVLEANRVFVRLRKEGGFWADLGAMTDPSRQVAPSERLVAARRMLTMRGNWAIRWLALETIRRWADYPEAVAVTARFAGDPELEPRQRAVARAELATMRGQWKEALRQFAAARGAPGDLPANDALHWLEMTAVVGLDDRATRDAWVRRGLDNPKAKGQTLLSMAGWAKNDDLTPERIHDLKLALAEPLDPDQVVLATRIAGAHLLEIADGLKAAAKRHPYTWQTQFVLFLVATLQKDAAGAQAATEMWDRYMDDDLSVAVLVCSVMSNLLEESVILGRTSREDYTAQIDTYFLGLKPYVGRFGYDAELWGDFIRYGLTAQRNAQVRLLLDRYLKFKPGEIPTELRPLLFLIDLNTAVGPAATKLWDPKAFSPQELADPTWIWAAYQAATGRPAVARTLIKGLRAPSEPLQPFADSLRAYLAALAGDRATAKKLLAKDEQSVAVAAFHGLAWAALGDWKQALPRLERQRREWMWSYLFVQKLAIQKLDERYRKLGQWEKHRELVYDASMAQIGNPLFAHFGYGREPGLAQFKGTIALNGGGSLDDKTTFPGKLRLVIDGAGVVSGSFAEEGGPIVPIAGRVDGYGNLTGTATIAGKPYRVAAKIAPPALYASFAKFRETGQFVQLVGLAGDRVALVGWTEPSPPRRPRGSP